MKPRTWYVYRGDRLVAVVEAITESGALAYGAERAGCQAHEVTAQTTFRERK
ncbi:hypothetical protein [Paraburkholderia sp. GAS448]|uniref:hypothetical protein n=1 Tax=Paraburkholderia sp. GAS448 TaxID=3035136 RepID=UPI003D21F6E7